MVDIHAITLHAFIQFLARIAPFTGIDIGIRQRNFFNDYILVSAHPVQYPVQQRF
jgi:hypothetical protein